MITLRVVRKVAACGAAFSLALTFLACATHAAWGELVSVSSEGQLGNAKSLEASLSHDGRYVAFTSAASNLVSGDTNNTWDVFVRDRLLGLTKRVSVSGAGEQGNGVSRRPSISGDGRCVAFESVASNLVLGDTNGFSDIFVADTATGAVQLVSLSGAAEQADGNSVTAKITPDGRHVVFSSEAANLVPADTNGVADIFVRDRLLGTTERASVSSAGEQANGRCLYPSVTADGMVIAFESAATNLVPGDTNGTGDIFLYDRVEQQTLRVSVATDYSEGDGYSHLCAVSGNGTYVAFWSSATNLAPVPGDGPNLILRDLAAQQTSFVPLGRGRELWPPAFSADGRYLAYTRWWLLAPALDGVEEYWEVTLFDTSTGRTTDVTYHGREEAPAISGDGRFVAADSFGFEGQVWVAGMLPDSVPPETEIVSGPCGQVMCAAEPVVISWRGSDDQPGPLAFSWRLDAGPWSAWTTDMSTTLTGLSNGQHLFEVKARDLSGNEDPTPAQCAFTVDTVAPTVSISSPANGAVVGGMIHISASASDPGGIERVEFYVRGEVLCSDTSAPYSCDWDTTPTSVQEGPAGICVKAFDSCGRSSQQCISVTVSRQTFEDVPNTSPFWPYVEAIASRGITAGCSAHPPLYCPYAAVSRAQLAKFVCLAAGKTWLDRETPTFTDVPRGHSAYGWIERLVDGNSWGGTPPAAGCEFIPKRKFCPDSAVTREYLAMVLCLATGKSQMSSCSGRFADVSSMNPFCRFIERLTDGGSWPGGVAVTSGCGVNPLRYCPTSPVTRGQMAVFLVRAFGIGM